MPPIHWRAWSPEVFAEANGGDKPVLLSLVTAWSDECAAMDETTYANPEVVSLIEARFVPIRVDADRRPDVNERYNLGGWPTTSFLTAAGGVLAGGTYFDAAGMIATLRQVADAYRDRRDELAARATAERHRVTAGLKSKTRPTTDSSEPAGDPIEHFRALLLDRFDPVHGGFGSAPKQPHAHALLFGLSLARESADSEFSNVIDASVEAIDALWDPVEGGFHRYADGTDWSDPASEKTSDDHALLLHVFVEAALRGGGQRPRQRAADIVQWLKKTLSDPAAGGFYNAQTARIADKTKYVDKNGAMVGALIRAAALFDDIWLRDLALEALEAVVVPTYKPGSGVAHIAGDDGIEPSVRGFLTDQVHSASALIWAHAATGRLPYSMLAAELLQFAVRTMWDESRGCFRDRATNDDPLHPFELNCQAACVLSRLAAITEEKTHLDRAQSILNAMSGEYRRQDLFGAPYALAIREVVEHQLPAGLELAKVDWGLG